MSTTPRTWIAVVGAALVVIGLALPRGWYDTLPRQPGYPPPPIKGVTLLQCAIAADGLLFLWAAARRRVFVSVPEAQRPRFSARAPDEGEELLSRAGAAWAVAGITCAGLMLRLWRLDSDLWLDEITPIQDYGPMTYLQVVATYYASNNHLLNTLLVKLSVAAFGEHEWAVRLPAVIFGAATIPVLYWIARMTATRIVSAGAALLLAFSYHHIFFSQNARGYAGHILLSVAAAGLLVRALKHDRTSLWGLYIAAMVLNMAVLLHGAFVLAAHGLVGAAAVASVWRRGSAPTSLIAKLTAVFGLTAFLALELYATALPQAVVYITTTYTVPGSGYSPLSAEFARELVRGIAQGLPPGALLAAVPAGLLGLAGWVILLRRQWAVTMAMTLPILLIGVTLLLGGLTFSPRFFLLALPVAMLAGVQGVYSLARFVTKEHRRPAAFAATAAVVLAALISLVPLRRYYTVPKQPYREAIGYVEAERSGNGIVIAIHLAERGYLYYGARYGLQENRDFFLARSVSIFDKILSSHPGQPVYLVTTLPRFLHIDSPELEQRIAEGWTVARTFPATVGDGAITVWKPLVHR